MSDAPMLDTEPADMYDPTAEPDPYAVAWRLHEQVSYLDPAVEHWLDLPPAAREALVAMAVQLLDELEVDPDDERRVARAVHLTRRATDPAVPSWEDLSADEQLVAVAIIAVMIVWLRAEGVI